jgi:hypothetical protein
MEFGVFLLHVVGCTEQGCTDMKFRIMDVLKLDVLEMGHPSGSPLLPCHAHNRSFCVQLEAVP